MNEDLRIPTMILDEEDVLRSVLFAHKCKLIKSKKNFFKLNKQIIKLYCGNKKLRKVVEKFFYYHTWYHQRIDLNLHFLAKLHDFLFVTYIF